MYQHRFLKKFFQLASFLPNFQSLHHANVFMCQYVAKSGRPEIFKPVEVEEPTKEPSFNPGVQNRR
jgi:hypothetical protein